ncbi:hypothetical protein [Flavobacterium sp. 3HN19-14]|uniref:hypothetical protein n=1 Tax=Flavobacterium sp. 3HN19-14 TaxID=3448133 RepID=UPI003EE24C4D
MKNLIFSLLLFTIASRGQQNTATIKLDAGSSVTMYREPFDPKKHKIEYKDNFVIAIDNSPLFGSDGEMPKFQLSKAILTIGQKTYDLQVDNMYNPWFGENPNQEFFEIIHGSANDHILKIQFSDGAGSYAAEWLIEWNSSIRDMITKDEVIIQSYFEK